MMTIEDVKNTIYTQLKAAEKQGNEAKKSLMYNIYLYIEELEQRRHQDKVKESFKKKEE